MSPERSVKDVFGPYMEDWGGRWDLNPRHSEPQSEGSGGSPNDFRGFSIQKRRKRELKWRVFNPSFSQVLGSVMHGSSATGHLLFSLYGSMSSLRRLEALFRETSELELISMHSFLAPLILRQTRRASRFPSR